MIEKAIFITNIKNFRYLAPKYSRIYFGHEFCEKLIPTAYELKKVITYCGKNKLGFSLVTPYVTNLGLGNLEKLFFWLQDNMIKCEVVINDYGVLDLISEKYPNLLPVMGRLLTKQKRDPRILRLIKSEPGKRKFYKMNNQHFIVLSKKAPDALVSYFKEANINIPIIRSFLNRYRARRAEIDNLLQGIKLKIPKRDLSVSLYVPYGYIATTRLCSANPFRHPRSFSCRISSCQKECKKYSLKLRSKHIPQVIYKKGNTLFYRNQSVPPQKELLKLGIDRVVYQPEIPI